MSRGAARLSGPGWRRGPPDAAPRGWSLRQQAEIDELRVARDMLEERLAHYVELYDDAPVGQVTLGPDGAVLEINLEGARLLGRERLALLGRPFSLHVAPEHLVRFLGLLRRLRRGARSAAVDLRLRAAAGTRHVRMIAATRGASGPCRAALQEAEDESALIRERDRLIESERGERVRSAAARRRLRAIEAVMAGFVPNLTPDEQLREILARVRLAVGADGAAVALRERGDALKVRAAVCRGFATAAEGAIPPGLFPARRAVARQQPVLVRDLAKEKQAEPALRRRARSAAAVPLMAEGRLLGALQVIGRHPAGFGEDDLGLLEFAAARLAGLIDRARLAEEVRAGRERMVRLAGRILDVEERERRAIARELHDEIGQLLTGLQCFLETEDRAAAARRGAAAAGRRRRLRLLKNLVGEAMRRVRGLCMSLRPPGLEGRDLATTLRWHCDRYAERTGIRVRLEASIDGRRLPSDLQAACFRIVQEALTNVARHARVGEARVGIRAGPGHLHLEIRDRGRGFDVASILRRPTCGLSGMRERTLLLGGDLSIRSARGAGTTIAAVLPIPRGRPAATAPPPAGRPLARRRTSLQNPRN